ncbi:hypothetical protein WL21_06585 [Burkholderia ubonensis]|uniref:hypothetical protein n=1 Tax=Burkholderia ubonensis TaxID=101571 RepID=UPI000758B9C4|nr:hypothetical protein [Burkholderia ubonensis]KVO86847.1 hypothetical protein WJ81_19640 [Burkholderia ubonensis]KVZ56561.1 hypothetical protein WL20_03650 [Burkholderia ubonensis]KVZ72205.1 hypothetical protein WL21_06585 [Burkholderia ubonensis]
MNEIEELRAQLERERARADGMAQRSLDDQLRAAATKAGLHAHAVDDALFRGRHMFTLDENGHAVQLGEDGQPVLGKDGKTPFSPAEWLDSMKETAPHWFPVHASGSGGGSGVRGAGIHRQDRAHMSPAEKSAYISKHGRDAYMALPDTSGSRR